MKPAPFEYRTADSVEEVIEILRQNGGDAKPLAGGQSLIPAMNFRLAQPGVLVDLNRLDGLSAIEDARDALVVGAMTRQREVERSVEVANKVPLLQETMPLIAHAQIRNRGTIGGSLAHADPAAELPAVMTALDATFRVRGPSGDREISAADFFTGLFATAMSPEEILVAVSVPHQRSGSGAAIQEVSRRHGDYALAGAAAVVELDGDRCRNVRLTLFSVGDGPVVAAAAQDTLAGETAGPEAIAAAADAAASQDVDPPGDIHGSAEYRRHLVGVLARRVLTRAVERARENT